MFDSEKFFSGLRFFFENFILQRRMLYEGNIAEITHCAVYDSTCNKYTFNDVN